MQRQLVGTLQHKSRLAALGLAVAKINHDLRNMLSSAQLFSDRLTDSDDPLVMRFAPKLIKTLDRAIVFCQSTLSYGRAVEQPPARRLVQVGPLVDDARELLGLGGEERVAWIEAIEPGLTVDADPDQLFRVLLNLTRNALEALEGKGETDPAQDHIRVTGRREGRIVSIEVSDTGPGVPERAKPHLFEAFSGSARPGGTGLGLAIASELVRAHGGTRDLCRGHDRRDVPDRDTGPHQWQALKLSRSGDPFYRLRSCNEAGPCASSPSTPPSTPARLASSTRKAGSWPRTACRCCAAMPRR